MGERCVGGLSSGSDNKHFGRGDDIFVQGLAPCFINFPSRFRDGVTRGESSETGWFGDEI